MVDIIQIVILILGAISIFLICIENRYGYIIGILGQPFWLYITYHGGLWGMFLLSIWYTLSFGIGIYKNFWR